MHHLSEALWLVFPPIFFSSYTFFSRFIFSSILHHRSGDGKYSSFFFSPETDGFWVRCCSALLGLALLYLNVFFSDDSHPAIVNFSAKNSSTSSRTQTDSRVANNERIKQRKEISNVNRIGVQCSSLTIYKYHLIFRQTRQVCCFCMPYSLHCSALHWTALWTMYVLLLSMWRFSLLHTHIPTFPYIYLCLVLIFCSFFFVACAWCISLLLSLFSVLFSSFAFFQYFSGTLFVYLNLS